MTGPLGATPGGGGSGVLATLFVFIVNDESTTLFVFIVNDENKVPGVLLVVVVQWWWWFRSFS